MLETTGDLDYPKLPTYSISYYHYLIKKKKKSQPGEANKQTNPP